MSMSRQPRRLGIVGGLGPFASSEFLRTLYECSACEAEQAMPAVMLWSDPAVPDRTRALADGGRPALGRHLAAAVGALLELECSRIVVCCFTMHAALPELPPEYRERIVSLVDVAIEQIGRRGERQLLLCSSGTRAMRLFERHPRWAEVESLVAMPRSSDQESVHRLIHAIKQSGDADAHVGAAGALLGKYAVGSLAVACSEFHLLAKAARRRGVAWRTCDPLDWVARAWTSNELPAAAAAVSG